MSNNDASTTNTPPTNFIHQIIEQDIQEGRNGGKVVTRFPPEPNGYLHIGHAKSICLNFGTAEKYNGECNLRFDDTNPSKEDQEYVDAIKEDVQWLGFKWAGEVRYASDYFDQFYAWAQHLIRNGNAYVCDLSPEEASEYRGWATKPGKNSPFRERSAEESLDLLERMKQGEFEEGSRVLRAKIDMTSSNMNMRDPILYRIRKQSHHQTGDKWCIYPNYDFAHGQEDAIEGVTHSICTLEFADHRPLYEWFIENLPVPSKPRQYEFGRLNINYTVTSKRKLKQLVDEGVVSGWNDPRMPTISGMRRRGYSAQAVRNFCDSLAVAKTDGVVDMAQFEFFVREDLNENSARAMCVLNPLKVTITNFPEGEVEMMTAPAHPQKEMGSRSLPFTREIYIDRNDFNEDSTLSRKKFKKLVPGDFMRLRSAYVIKAEEVIKDDSGEVTEIKATLVPGTVGENPPAEMKPRGVMHWVSATHGKQVKVRVYDRLFSVEKPNDDDFLADINPDSYVELDNCWAEPDLINAQPETVFQFEREGYFVADRYDHDVTTPTFNKTIGLKDSWVKK
ncbi:glutamine--tRNA ligase/YqeY domain fusion protein [Aliamphritea spongicola]|uniref:glutamine--tRNA ligase/YqeY domain fusion protein n=1 Tax=Aliamphritea spongicola TaxID=707589 RepID=UPI00196ACFF7|nr:glutamine--tRNA ligase/YqeY domain fusion protein [Aliamphritea spongicola]MBN3561359.1 glutamine--tRNA ligase/YqeY domain fusion protein [Aliamphritea spongicola]